MTCDVRFVHSYLVILHQMKNNLKFIIEHWTRFHSLNSFMFLCRTQHKLLLTILRQKSHMVIVLLKFKRLLSGFEQEPRKEITAGIPINAFHKLQYDCFWIYLITVAYWLCSYCLMSVKKPCCSMNSLLFVFGFLFYGRLHLQVTYQYMEFQTLSLNRALSNKHFQIRMHSNACIWSGINRWTIANNQISYVGAASLQKWFAVTYHQ